MKLSICVITMNRAHQLKEALESCLACDLPNETEFVIIDNASTDDTEEGVYKVLGDCGKYYYYEKLSENLGVGGGRNYAYGKSRGDFVYVLDDDAVIDIARNPDFFAKAISIFEQYSNVVTLTTQIYDTAWKRNRIGDGGPKIADNLYKCQMFCGGSHFLRKSFFTNELYLSNKYGFEEIPPSLYAANSGKINAFCSELFVIHKPVINKWDWDDKKNDELHIKAIALPYAIKKMMYPMVFAPILYLAKWRRTRLYLSRIDDAKSKVKCTVKEFYRDYSIDKKIKVSTVWRMFKDFKIKIF